MVSISYSGHYPLSYTTFRLLPQSDTSAVPSLTPILIAAQAWPKSLYSLEILAIPEGYPEDEHRELLRMCDAKGIELDELRGWGMETYMDYWECLALGWLVTFVSPVNGLLKTCAVQRFSRSGFVCHA
jgi:hypothetical protein